jgi:hypothetical protein
VHLLSKLFIPAIFYIPYLLKVKQVHLFGFKKEQSKKSCARFGRPLVACVRVRACAAEGNMAPARADGPKICTGVEDGASVAAGIGPGL